MSAVSLFHGDCLDIMPALDKVDMILADLPYGTTACKWDVRISFKDLWKEYKRLRKEHVAIVLFCTQPFTSALIMSNVKEFKYCWDWDKVTGKGHLVAKIRPLQQTEQVAVFGKDQLNYYPIKTPRDKPVFQTEGKFHTEIMGGGKSNYRGRWSYSRYPKTLLRFSWSNKSKFHVTEKPVPLLEYLIKTYSNEGDVVLDNTMGSGSTGVACVRTKRRFIGIEKNQKYFEIAQQRISDAEVEMAQRLF